MIDREKDPFVTYDLDHDRFYSSKENNELQKPISGLLTMCVHLGYNCNLHCMYCSSKDYEGTESPFILDDLEKFLLRNNIPRVVISGGEPFLYSEKLVQYLRVIKKCGAYSFVSTNGTLPQNISQEILDLIDWVDISLPATTPQLYQEIRGSDHFYEALSFIHRMVNANKRVRISYTLSSHNIADVFELPSFSKTIGVSNIRISHTYGLREGLIWTPEQSTILKARFSEIYPEALIYTPLSVEELDAYQRGYLLLAPDGFLYVFNTSYTNRLFSIKDAFLMENENRIKQLSFLQKKLFCINHKTKDIKL